MAGLVRDPLLRFQSYRVSPPASARDQRPRRRRCSPTAPEPPHGCVESSPSFPSKHVVSAAAVGVPTAARPSPRPTDDAIQPRPGQRRRVFAHPIRVQTIVILHGRAYPPARHKPARALPQIIFRISNSFFNSEYVSSPLVSFARPKTYMRVVPSRENHIWVFDPRGCATARHRHPRAQHSVDRARRIPRLSLRARPRSPPDPDAGRYAPRNGFSIGSLVPPTPVAALSVTARPF